MLVTETPVQPGDYTEILVNPYTESNQNLISIRAVSDIDVGIRHLESFAAISDVVAN